MAKAKTFPLSAHIDCDTVKVSSNDATLVNCPSKYIRGVIDLLASLIDEDIPAILHNNASQDSSFCINLDIDDISEQNMIFERR